MEKVTSVLSFICLCCAVIIAVHTSTYSSEIRKQSIPVLKDEVQAHNESHYIKHYCKGTPGYIHKNGTRTDCLTEEYSIEFEWAKQWANGIGKSLYISKKIGKKPAVALILKNATEEEYAKKIETAAPDIKVFRIKTYLDE